MYKQFYELLKKNFEYHDVSKEEYSSIHFDVGFTPEHILKVIKWLFIGIEGINANSIYQKPQFQ